MEGKRSRIAVLARAGAASLAALAVMVQAQGTALAWSGFAAPQNYPIGHQPVAVAAVGQGGNAVAVAVRGDNAVRTVQRTSSGSPQLVASVTVGAGPVALLPVVTGGATYPSVVLVANHDDNTVSLVATTGGVPYTNWQEISVPGGPDAMALADVNGDTFADAIVASGTTGTLTVLDGNGHGGFTNGGVPVSVGVDPVAVASTALRSTAPLIAVADAGSDDVRLLTTSNGVLVPVVPPITLSGPPSAVAFDDIVPGQTDLVVTTRAGAGATSGALTVIPVNNVSGNPLSPSESLAIAPQPSGLVVTDLNGDGYVDAAVTDDQQGTVTAWLNDGGGGLHQYSSQQVGGAPASIAAAHLFGNGLTDLATADSAADRLAILAGQDPEISLSTGRLDFGPIPAGTTATGTFTITNTGVTALSVSSLSQPSAPFSITSDGCSGTSVAPGASCAVQVTFAPTQSGQFTDYIDIQDNAANGQKRVDLRGSAT